MARAIEGLKNKNWVVPVHEGTRPQAPGAAAEERRAAVFDLPHRHRGRQARVPLPRGTRAHDGNVRMNVHRLRADVRDLTGTELRVLYLLAGDRRRTAEGRLADGAPFRVSSRALATTLGLSHSAVAQSLDHLRETGRLERMARASGRSGGCFLLGQAYRSHERLFAPMRKPSFPHGDYKGSWKLPQRSGTSASARPGFCH